MTLFIAFTLITGIVYPLVVTGIAQLLFPYQATGSLIERDGQIIGSDLIAQSFSNPEYFWSRPSAVNYDATASGGRNLGPGSEVLLSGIESRSELLQADAINLVPVDLVTSSASGLDPHITPASAYYQAARVAAARGIPIETVEQLITDHIEVQSQVDGKMYDSKSALRRSYKANGYIEVGNEPLKPGPRIKPDRKAIRDSVGKAMSRVGIL